MKRYARLLCCSAVALAVIYVLLVLTFSLRAQEPTDPGIVGNNAVNYAPVTLNAGSGEEIVHCFKTDQQSGKPSACKLMGKHTLDEVIQYIWQENEKRRELYREQADALRSRIAPQAKWIQEST